ncbi:MAG: nuclear transport factor 2 family protein [Caldilineaceae bacterium]
MLDNTFASHFAQEWIDAWNSHDMTRILAHYRDDFVMSSPKIVQIAGEPSGVLRGKPAVAAYWTTALSRLPDLRFELIGVYAGVDRVVIHYFGAGGQQAAESFVFDSNGLVIEAAAHYAT